MLTKLFQAVLTASLSVAPVLGLLLLAGPFLRGRYRSATLHLIWIAAAVRLLLPLPAPERTVVVIPAGEAVLYLEEGSDAARALAQAALRGEGPAEGDAPARGFSWLEILALLWAAGASLALAGNLAAYGRTRRYLKRWSVPVTDPATLEILEECKARQGIGRSIRLCRSPAPQAPLLIGYGTPVIVLPCDRLPAEQLRHVLCHELAHYGRRDLWAKLVLLIACCVHWFNPLAWLMVRAAAADMERACDAKVLALNGRAAREYGLSLLSVLDRGPSRPLPLTTGFFGSRKQLRERFAAILDGRARKAGGTLAATALAAVLLCGGLIGFGGAAAPAQEADPAAEVPAEISTEPATEPDFEMRVGEWTATTEEEILQSQKEAADTQSELDSILKQVEFQKNPYVGGEMRWPVPGFSGITSYYGWRFGGSDFHTGIDISGAAIHGADVAAANDGTVAYVNWAYRPGIGYGVYLVLDHGGGVTTLYAQLSTISVSVGDAVVRGQKIGEVGSTGYSTGPHLHFEVREDGVHGDPLGYFGG